VLRDLWVRVDAEGPAEVLVNGEGVREMVNGDGWVAFKCDLEPGDTQVAVNPAPGK